MKDNVLIKITGLQSLDEISDSVELMARGKYYEKNEKHYLLYDDIEEETGVKTKNTIKFTDNHVELTRNGVISGKLVFKKGENNQSLYSTPYGDMLLEVMTKDIELKKISESINLRIDYELYANNNKVSDSRIEIDIQGS